MSAMRYFCCDDHRRRTAIDGRMDINGIDFLEVLDEESLPLAERQRTLFVHFINNPSGLSFNEKNVRIEGGEREEYRDPRVETAQISVDPRSGSTFPVLVVTVKSAGDFSIYTLRLIADKDNPHVLDNIDPMLRAVDFSFKANCESNFDCLEQRLCPAELRQEPAINYLARDYNSFRQLMLDRMAVLMPDWKERNPADMGVTLVELLAYVGDYLSYRQDAVATETYLDTARRRVSVRRHARLVDYLMHDGCNARAWMHVQVNADITLDKGTPFFTAVPEIPPRVVPDSVAHRNALGAGTEVFESMHTAELFSSLNRLEFYTWGARECCLPKGATKATLRGRLTDLKPGMVLIFQEVCNPRTGNPDDADPRHRHAVRLVDVWIDDLQTGNPLVDPIGGQFESSPSNNPISVTEITWAQEDALPFPVCVSAEADDAFGGAYIEPVSIALGNIVLVDHGRKITGEDLGQVPKSILERIPHPDRKTNNKDERCRRRDLETVPPRFRPKLEETPLTQAVPYDHTNPPCSAYETMNRNLSGALPSIKLNSQVADQQPRTWLPRRDLLNSGRNDEFVVEVESDGRAYLRFGDGDHGARPSEEAKFTADYRIGNGVRGNVGADSLIHVVSNDGAIEKVTNPLPAKGGVEMESIEQVRQNAPEAFRSPDKQERAVTPADYAAITTRHPQVQKASAQLRWTGSWHTMFVTVDPMGGARLDDGFESKLRDYLEPYRLAGHDLEIDRPRMVPLELEMTVDVNSDYERSRVRSALLQIFSNRDLPDGRRGVFHPDNFTFGQPVFLSPLYAAAQAVPGVESVDITIFQRQEAPGPEGVQDGKLAMGRFEIARLDDDPNYPGRGEFRLKLRGGR
jgi:hypothetical protein